MAGNLPDAIEAGLLDHLHGVATLTITGPLRCRLMTAAGSDSAAGTEVTGGSYSAQTIVFSAASAGATSNSGALSYTSMPACTVVGVEIWDSTGTPKRLWYLPLSSSKTLQAGDTFSLAVGAVTVSLD